MREKASDNQYLLLSERVRLSTSDVLLNEGDRCKRKSQWEKWEAGHYLVHPHSSVLLPWWDLFMCALIVMIAFLVPYEVGFELLDERTYSNESQGVRRFTYKVDLCFFFDMVLQFFTSYYNHVQKRWVRKPMDIVKAYINGTFTVDVLSVVPYVKIASVLGSHFGENFRLTGVLSMLGLLRLLRVSRMIERYEARLNLEYSYVNMVKLIVILILSVHLAACFWGFILSGERFFNIQEEHTWLTAVVAAKPALFTDHTMVRPWELYTASLYWSAMTTTSIGYGDVTAMTKIEAWGCTVAMLATGVIWANIIGNVCAIASTLNEQKVAYENQIDSLNHWMDFLNLPLDFRMELRSFFMVKRSVYHREKQVELLRAMSPELQHRLARHVQASWVTKIWFFRDIPDNGFMVGMFERFAIAVYPPRELVKLPSSLCNLQQGMVLRGFHIHFPGDYWGVTELLLSNKDLLEDVSPVALSYLELQHLTREALEELCNHFPAEKRMIRRATVWLALCRGLSYRQIKPSWHSNNKLILQKGNKFIKPSALALGFGKRMDSSSNICSSESDLLGSPSGMKLQMQDLDTRVAGLEKGMQQALEALSVLKERSDKIEARKHRL